MRSWFRKASPSTRTIIFVCTGNIFRSVVAEYSLKAHLKLDARYVIGSAGIKAGNQPMLPLLREQLKQRGIDPRGHRPRQLTEKLLKGADLVVAMSTDHQDFIKREFGREVPLFSQVASHTFEPILDVHEVIPDWETRIPEARDYILSVVERIWTAMPLLVTRLPKPGPMSSNLGEADRPAT
jgi:protein-tyrosine phosphatase